MKQTRRIAVSDRVFTAQDLLRIAKILDRQDRPTAGERHFTTEYQVTFDNNTTIAGDSPDVFGDEVLTTPARPVAIRMASRDYSLARERSITIALAHGDSTYGSEIVVSGSETAWLSETFLALKDTLDRTRPQDVWFRRHQTLLLNLIALGLGSLGMLILDLLVVGVGTQLRLQDLTTPLPPDSPWRRVLNEAWPFLYMGGWLWRWMAGFAWGAFSVRRWLLATWPSIEFDFGLPHLQREKLRRKRLTAVVALIVLPIFTTLVYDLIKRVFF